MNNILSLIGIAHKAGYVAIGDEPVSDAIRHGGARLIVIASDAAENTKERFRRLSSGEDKVLHLEIPDTKAALGHILGRALCSVAAVCDTGLAAQIALKLTSDMDPESREAKLARRLSEKSKKSTDRNGGAR